MQAIVTVLSILLLFPGVVLGKSLYVRNSTNEALVRTGPSITNKIVVILKPGQEVTLVREEGDYYVVTTPNGVRGYVLKYLMTEQTPEADTVPELEQKTRQRIAELEAKTQEQEKELTLLREERAGLEAAKKQAEVAGQQAEARANQQAELASRLQTQQSAVRSDEARLWFLSGAGVLLVGFVLGWMWGGSSRRSRRGGLSLDRL
jgi:SH3 domain protein